MRFTVILGMMAGLAAALPRESPLERRQCSVQHDTCCIQTGTCQTCYYGTEPYQCNCQCLQYGDCPCTEYDNDTQTCLSWYAPAGGC
ncbi:hypothetical protein BGW36DRAFT_167386 [Talaromyces proteolyticus]|uniref:Uncharacterized protein n=1 Tax=Talaromyces proteolyticus TaxID=1131652 RepID=A0AAD4KV33_9EURO|nr:uncharacterized protein BGW36DRAFT_167386 [Talaromyces proteolyticus]KAH8697386.1 hypothetical protein BGW36DRAFT_167386 [Talaromyces proteolyticus]